MMIINDSILLVCLRIRAFVGRVDGIVIECKSSGFLSPRHKSQGAIGLCVVEHMVWLRAHQC